MFDKVNLCDFCFAPVEENQVCSKCGLTHKTYQPIPGLLKPGTVLNGKYVIGRSLGRGGFGATYTAYSPRDGRVLAIKEYFPQGISGRAEGSNDLYLSSEEDRNAFDKGSKRFEAEALALSKFNGSDNIVSVYEFFVSNKTVYYTMELLEGCDLRGYIKKHGGRLDPKETVHIMMEICRALMSLHSEKLLHRDISPDNIFVCNDGRVKLIDFGNARQVVSDATQNYSVVVKFGFSPPEQFSSNSPQGVWTDIYALGATMYYSLTGKLPPSAMDYITDKVIQLQYDVNIDSAIKAVIEKCVRFNSGERYQSVAELYDALRKIIEPSPLTVMMNNEKADFGVIDENNRVFLPIDDFILNVGYGCNASASSIKIVTPYERIELRSGSSMVEIQNRSTGEISRVVISAAPFENNGKYYVCAYDIPLFLRNVSVTYNIQTNTVYISMNKEKKSATDKKLLYSLLAALSVVLCVIVIALNLIVNDDDETIDDYSNTTLVVEEEEPESEPEFEVDFNTGIIQEDEISRIINTSSSHTDFGIYVINRTNEYSFGYNEDIRFSASGLAQVVILDTLSRVLPGDIDIDNDGVYFEYIPNGKEAPNSKDENGELLPLRKYIEDVAIYGDNNKSNTLIDCIGYITNGDGFKAINDTLNKNFFSNTNVHRKTYTGPSQNLIDEYAEPNMTSAKDIARIFDNLIYGNKLGDVDYMMNIFKSLSIEGDPMGLKYYVPGEYDCANANARNSQSSNNVAVIRNDDQEIIVAILSITDEEHIDTEDIQLREEIHGDLVNYIIETQFEQ